MLNYRRVNPSVCLRPSPNVFFFSGSRCFFCPGDASPAKDGRAAEVVHAGSENWHLLWLVLTGTMEFYDFPYIGNNDPNWRTPSFFRAVGIPPTSSYTCWNLDLLSIFPHWCFPIRLALWVPQKGVIKHGWESAYECAFKWEHIL